MKKHNAIDEKPSHNTTGIDKKVIEWVSKIRSLRDQSEFGRDDFISKSELLLHAYNCLLASGWSATKSKELVCMAAYGYSTENENYWANPSDPDKLKRGNPTFPEGDEEADYKLFIDVQRKVNKGSTAHRAVLDVCVDRKINGKDSLVQIDQLMRKYYKVRDRYLRPDLNFENLDNPDVK